MENNLIKILIMKRTITTKEGRKFNHFFTIMSLAEGKGKEIQERFVDVKFAQTCDVSKFGRKNYIYVTEDDYIAPWYYQIKDKKDKNGNVIRDANGNHKKEYPHVWIKGFDHFEVCAPTQNRNAFVTEEKPTKETTID